MPSLANGNGTTMGSATKFQLPALDLRFGSLTEGTNIPPPLPSPIQEEPPEQQPQQPAKPSLLAVDEAAKPSTAATTTTTNGFQEASANGLKRPAEDAVTPVSPTSAKGSASIRRLFSRNRLNEAYHANGEATTGEEGFFPRPPSQSNASVATDRQSKRTSGWFRRLRGSDGLESSNKRSSRIFFTPDNTKPAIASPTQPTGPPPPMIPEFKALGSKVDLKGDEGSLGADLFKNIN